MSIDTRMRASAVVAEDEAPQRADLCRLLAELWPELRVIECEDGLTALEALESQRPEIAFLDIRMPGLDGLELARAASGISRIVFTTAYDEYAVQAFEHGALDYLLKPIRRDRLALTLQRLRERLANPQPVADLTAIANALQPLLARSSRECIRWITASVGNTTKIFPIDEVLFFRAQEKYTHVVTATDNGYLRMSLKELSAVLDSNEFWQVHRSVIVRVAAIRSVRRGADGKLALTLKTSHDELPVSGAFQYRFKPM